MMKWEVQSTPCTSTVFSLLLKPILLYYLAGIPYRRHINNVCVCVCVCMCVCVCVCVCDQYTYIINLYLYNSVHISAPKKILRSNYTSYKSCLCTSYTVFALLATTVGSTNLALELNQFKLTTPTEQQAC